jgi:predicted N-acyltransferase
MAFLNQLEPDGLLRHFRAHPPTGFQILDSTQGTPVFVAPFDLLTTAEEDVRRRVAGLPLYRFWSRLLRPRTCFVGTTVTEYAVFPDSAEPVALARSLKSEFGRRHTLLIVKDIPQDSPLLDARANSWSAEFARSAGKEGFVLLEGQALAWVPIDFASTDDYLALLSSSRRKNMRRKLRSREALDIEAVPTGSAFDDPARVDEFYALYSQVYAQSEIHFDLLERDFFRAVLQDAQSEGIVFVYRHKGEMIGWNLCYEREGRLLDKYIGLAYPQAREHNLYVVSWMHNLEYARQRGLTHYVAGWTDPEVKVQLGARLSFTRHAVYVRNPLLRAVLRRFAGHFESDRLWQERHATSHHS